MEYYGFDLKPQPEHRRKAKAKPKVIPDHITDVGNMKAQEVTQPAPVQNGHWQRNAVTGNWTFIRDQQPRPTGPIMVRMPIKPAHIPAPNMKAMVQPAPRPIRITAQHRTRRGGLTRRNDR
jgi:hypothetical protein